MRQHEGLASIGLICFALALGVAIATFTPFAIVTGEPLKASDWLGFVGSLMTSAVAVGAVIFAYIGVTKQVKLALVSREEERIEMQLPGLSDVLIFVRSLKLSKTSTPDEIISVLDRFKVYPDNTDGIHAVRIKSNRRLTSASLAAHVSLADGKLRQTLFIYLQRLDMTAKNTLVSTTRAHDVANTMLFESALSELLQFYERTDRQFELYKVRLASMRTIIEEYFDRP